MGLQVIVDGGCLGNGTPQAYMYGSAKIGEKMARWDFGSGGTNNIAEYKSLIAALNDVLVSVEFPGQYDLVIMMDTLLIPNQVMRNWKVKKVDLRSLCEEAQRLLGRFRSWRFEHLDEAEVKKILGH